jgi:hypothetical protein
MRKHVITVLVLWLGLGFVFVPNIEGQQATPGTLDQESAEKSVASQISLRMTPGIVCRSIDGYEAYERLPGAAQTSEEKLLVYFRPLGYQTELVDGLYQAHLAPDFQIRKRGQKAILRQKERFFEYKPRDAQPPQHIYMKSAISLKGLAPGNYDLTIILHDQVAKGSPATQVVKFKIIPAIDPRTKYVEIQSDGEPASP